MKMIILGKNKKTNRVEIIEVIYIQDFKNRQEALKVATQATKDHQETFKEEFSDIKLKVGA